MRFYEPQLLWLLLIVPVLAVLIFLISRARRKASRKIGNPETVQRLFGKVNISAGNFSILSFLIGVAFLIGAVARPQYPGGVEKIEARGGKVVIALDIS